MDALPLQSRYHLIEAREDPGETPAMTYYDIEYEVTLPSGERRRERVYCAYMRDTGEATPRQIPLSSQN